MEFQLVSSQKAQSTNKLKVLIKVLWGKGRRYIALLQQLFWLSFLNFLNFVSPSLPPMTGSLISDPPHSP